MNEILVGASIVLVVLLTFASGFFMGRGFREKQLLPVEPAVPDRIIAIIWLMKIWFGMISVTSALP